MDNLIIALTGPSGSGKTTLSDKLVLRDNFFVPTHTTTRSPRTDDSTGLYRHLNHDEFRREALLNNFLFWSGDSDIIDMSCGNFYGVLKRDFDNCLTHNRLILYVSYKDIENIFKLKKAGYNIEIINLLYSNLQLCMPIRLTSNNRNHSKEDIKNRITCAMEYEKNFRCLLDSYDILKIYTDLYDEEETYDIVKSRKLK